MTTVISRPALVRERHHQHPPVEVTVVRTGLRRLSAIRMSQRMATPSANPMSAWRPSGENATASAEALYRHLRTVLPVSTSWSSTSWPSSPVSTHLPSREIATEVLRYEPTRHLRIVRPVVVSRITAVRFAAPVSTLLPSGEKVADITPPPPEPGCVHSCRTLPVPASPSTARPSAKPTRIRCPSGA